MPYVIKHRRPPEPWVEFKSRIRYPFQTPLYALDWACEHIAYRLGNWSFLEVLEYVGSFSILVAVIAYFAGADERTQQRHYQAWQVINTAQGKGGSGGRVDALQNLNDDHVPLVGVDLSEAFLQDVRLEKAELRRALIRSADLRNAHLARARLQDADLRSSNFRAADLSNADLTDAQLTDADLARANLKGARLAGANLAKADLRDADLSGTVDWNKIAGIRLANVHNVRNAPVGFVQWALGQGAVQVPNDEQWQAMVAKAGQDKEGK